MQMVAQNTAGAQGSRSRFSIPDVARLFELPQSKLRYWSQTGFLVPSIREHGRSFYTFQDLIAVKVAKELLEAGLPLQRVRRSLDALRFNLPRVTAPLSSLRVRCADDRVLVDDREGTFEAATGQLLLDFEVASLSDRVAEVLTLPWVEDGASSGRRSAVEWFLEGCALERDAGADEGVRRGDARRAYERAVELDPQLGAAWTNLGSMLAESGDLDGARDHFDRALRCDPDQPEAQANLAELALRDGDTDVAIAGYRQILRSTPDYVEAHYGLARALLMVGGKAQALAHLERFCAAVDALAPASRSTSLDDRRRSADDVIGILRRELAAR